MPDVAVSMQTPIMRSVRDKLKKVQEEQGFETIGETIGWLIEEAEKVEDYKTLCSELREEIEHRGD